MHLKFWGYKNCDTCRRAAKALETAGHQLEWIDITVEPPDAGLLGRILAASGEEARGWVNTSGQEYRKPGIKEAWATADAQERLSLLAGNGRLLKRPLVWDGARATVGCKAEAFRAVWGAG